MEQGVELAQLVGEWEGDNRLWVFPEDPVRISPTEARLHLAAGGALVIMEYTWAYEGDPQAGTLLVRTAAEADDVDVVWFDSWHTQGKFMLFKRETGGKGLVSVRGSYGPPEGPKWGWRIVLEAEGKERFTLRMYNITPDGEEAPAVEAHYSRR